MTSSPISCAFLSLTLLAGACIAPTENVGETPPEGGTGPVATGTDGEATTTGMSNTGISGTGMIDTGVVEETGLAGTGIMEETGLEASTGEAFACVDEEYDCFAGEYEPLDCGPRSVCDMLMVDQPFGDEEATNFVNPEAATCILDGLEAGTPGLYQVRVELEFNSVHDYRFDVHADGSVIQRIERVFDKSCSGVDLRLAMRPSDHFTGCEALGSDQLVLECLLDIGTPDACTFGPLCE